MNLTFCDDRFCFGLLYRSMVTPAPQALFHFRVFPKAGHLTVPRPVISSSPRTNLSRTPFQSVPKSPLSLERMQGPWLNHTYQIVTGQRPQLRPNLLQLPLYIRPSVRPRAIRPIPEATGRFPRQRRRLCLQHRHGGCRYPWQTLRRRCAER
jgi:hypothetical protein